MMRFCLPRYHKTTFNVVELIYQFGKYRILTEFKVFMYWKDPARTNRNAEPRTPKNEVSIRLTQRRVKFSS